ncbi:MAG: hypothetical protein GX117_03515 [Candidatus Hydrogenedentes bacterium]|jgi:hypothetical protein|nr:hypothetical protein [Candidatus Hydrogenedentota bacterium]
MDPIYSCHKCGNEWSGKSTAQPGFKESCSRCGAYLHCCLNCSFHRKNAHNQCYIPGTEYVADRKGLNFCEEFKFRSGTTDNSKTEAVKQQSLEKFAQLFGENPSDSDKLSFDDLFRK